MVNLKTLYVDAARIVDEAGKGTEVLRQQVVSFVENNGRYNVLVAEADLYIRSAYAFAITGPPTGGNVNVSVREAGSTSADNFTPGNVTLPLREHEIKDIPLTASRLVKRGELVEMNVANIAGSGAAVSLHLGWTPALWEDNQYKSYDAYRVLHFDAARVGDEDGKGAEVLRQQVATDLFDGTFALLVAEADCMLRSAYVTTITGSPTNGNVSVRKRTNGGVITVLGTRAVGANDDVERITITERQVTRGEVIEVVVSGLDPAGTRISVHLGWMPDLWTPGTYPHSYALPN